METKGTVIKALSNFVKETFGEDKKEEWIASLPPKAKEIYSSTIFDSAWYPLTETLTEPTKKICEMFYHGDLEGAWETGKYSSKKGLRGIYKFFVKIGSPAFTAKKASQVFSTYYKPSTMIAKNITDNSSTLIITEFDEIDEVIEHRIAGWIEQTLTICGCKKMNVSFKNQLSKGDDSTTIEVKWDY